jgi:hypothetical protein
MRKTLNSNSPIPISPKSWDQKRFRELKADLAVSRIFQSYCTQAFINLCRCTSQGSAKEPGRRDGECSLMGLSGISMGTTSGHRSPCAAPRATCLFKEHHGRLVHCHLHSTLHHLLALSYALVQSLNLHHLKGGHKRDTTFKMSTGSHGICLYI